MPFDGKNFKVENRPDLRKPTLKGLAWLLRHPEDWPPNHKWDFAAVLRAPTENHCGTQGCAIGVAQLTWPWCGELKSGWASRASVFDMAEREFELIFDDGDTLQTYGVYDDAKVTPSMVADAIDAYLTRK